MTGDIREPGYLCLDIRSAKIIRRLSDQDRLIFFDALLSVYDNLLTGNTDFEFPDNLVGELIRQAAGTIANGLDTYYRRVNANPSGKKPTGDPVGTLWVGLGQQSNQIKDNQIKDNQIIMQLKAEGFDDSEIDSALRRTAGRNIKDLGSYLRRTMSNDRDQKHPVKKVNAQMYQQRSYEGEDEEAMNRWLNMGGDEDERIKA